MQQSGLDAQDEAEFVVDFDRRFAETMLDAGSLDPRCELTTDLLDELGSDLVAEEGGDVFGFDSEDGLPGKLFIEGFQDGLRAEHQISGVLDLHETPMVGLSGNTSSTEQHCGGSGFLDSGIS